MLQCWLTKIDEMIFYEEVSSGEYVRPISLFPKFIHIFKGGVNSTCSCNTLHVRQYMLI